MAGRYGIPVPGDPLGRTGHKLHIRFLTKDSLTITPNLSDEFRLFL